MGFFSNVSRAVGGLFEEAGAAVGDVVEDIGTAILGPAGERGERIGTAIGGALEASGVRGATAIGGTLGGALSADIAAAPDVARERARQRAEQDQITQEMVDSRDVTEQDYLNMYRGREIYTAGLSDFDTGTVIDIRYPKSPSATAVGVGMDIVEGVVDYFFGDDDQGAAAQTGMAMCKPSMPKAFNVNRQTGCVTITRKQQAKLKEAVRMFGGAQVAKNLGISQQLLQQLLLKTFRARRKGISGADIRAVKRVDRQMHSLACALGGISSTSRAVASRKSPPKRSC